MQRQETGARNYLKEGKRTLFLGFAGQATQALSSRYIDQAKVDAAVDSWKQVTRGARCEVRSGGWPDQSPAAEPPTASARLFWVSWTTGLDRC